MAASGWIAAARKRVPFPIRQLVRHAKARVPLGLRYGREFRETRRFLEESQWWGRDRLAAHQLSRLEELVSFVHANVPFYREILEERGAGPGDIASIGDLRIFPFLKKELLRENADRIVPTSLSQSRLTRVTTGGTTGVPMDVYWERRVTEAREWAFVLRGWSWAGFRPGMRRVVLRGHIPTPRWRNPQPSWEYDPVDKQLFLSSYQMTNENLPGYVDRIRRFRPHAILAYPSSLLPLARFLLEKGVDLSGIRCVLTSSERLYPVQRALTEKALKVKIFDHYGTTERNVLVMQCEEQIYHVIPEYGILEIIGAEGEPVEEAGVPGEIVVTGFINSAMPLIRYRTGDIAMWRSGDCPCGREHDLLERIQGRVQEYFIDPDGTPATTRCSGKVLRKLADRIEAYQYIQEEPGRVLLNVEARGGLSAVSRERLRQRFNEHYPRIALRIRLVDNIERTGRGKFRYVVQKLPVGIQGSGADA